MAALIIEQGLDYVKASPIDPRQLERVFRSIWYKREGLMPESLMGRARSEVAALVWELNGNEDDVASVRFRQI